MFNHLINPEYAHSVALANEYTGEVCVYSCDSLSIAAKNAYKRASRMVREAIRAGEPAP